jgi:predicted nuclease of predicted toxin-antitoxin system
MTLKILIDMNLPVDWVDVFDRAGIAALHWSEVGDPRATDQTIMAWALDRGYVVFTHDLDFGTMLAATQAVGPSVIQVRTQDTFPTKIAGLVIGVLEQYEEVLQQGALISINERTARLRILPLRDRKG